MKTIKQLAKEMNLDYRKVLRQVERLQKENLLSITIKNGVPTTLSEIQVELVKSSFDKVELDKVPELVKVVDKVDKVDDKVESAPVRKVKQITMEEIQQKMRMDNGSKKVAPKRFDPMSDVRNWAKEIGQDYEDILGLVKYFFRTEYYACQQEVPYTLILTPEQKIKITCYLQEYPLAGSDMGMSNDPNGEWAKHVTKTNQEISEGTLIIHPNGRIEKRIKA